MGPTGCPETSVTKYHYTLRKFPKKQNSFTTRRKAEITHDSNMVVFRKGTIFVVMLVHVLKIGATKSWTVSSGYDIQITTKEFISWHGRATTLTGLVPCVTIIPCEILRYDLSAFVLHFGTAAPLCYELQSVGCCLHSLLLHGVAQLIQHLSPPYAIQSATRCRVTNLIYNQQPNSLCSTHQNEAASKNTLQFHTEPTGHKTHKITGDITDTSWVSSLL